MKKLLVIVTGVAALAGMGYLGSWVAAQDGARPAGGVEQATLKIGTLNITKVIKEFQKANVLGDAILKDAQKYEMELKGEQEKLKAEEIRIAQMPSETEKEAARKMFRERTNQLQDKDLAYQKDIRKRRDDMAITINKEIKQVVNSLAQHRKLELILQCPDVAVPEEENSLTDAMRRMTAPATWIAWRHPGIDITEEVIRWLNHYYPAPGGTAPGGAAPSGVTPTSGNK